MENWKPVHIPEYKHLYEVSDLGRVRRSAPGRRTRQGNILKASTGKKNGYLKVDLSKKDKNDPKRVIKTISVHVLVAHAFIGKRPDGFVIDHKNTIKTDCRADNLEYVTHIENYDRSIESGTRTKRLGSQLPWSVLKESDIPIIRQMLQDGKTCAEISRHFKVKRTAISLIKRGITWKHI